jgi:hypothetical protein
MYTHSTLLMNSYSRNDSSFQGLCKYHKLTVPIYRVPQEERSIFWEVIVSVILSKKVYIYICPIPNGLQDRTISLYSILDLAPNIGLPSHHTAVLWRSLWQLSVIGWQHSCHDVMKASMLLLLIQNGPTMPKAWSVRRYAIIA